MTTIDHAAEAQRVLRNAPHESIRGNDDALAWAQVQATLALVEQQRIANLVAYVTHAEGMPDGHKEWIEEELGL